MNCCLRGEPAEKIARKIVEKIVVDITAYVVIQVGWPLLLWVPTP
jgi:hypothetical protein